MLLPFFTALRDAKVPVSMKEWLHLMEAMDKDVAGRRVDDFYHLSRAVLVKDEKHYDRFDQVFGKVFAGVETVGAGVCHTTWPDAACCRMTAARMANMTYLLNATAGT